ncbi:MAG: hypothetical protein ACI4SF_01725, partial [Oscillospiraceae bacterium]
VIGNVSDSQSLSQMPKKSNLFGKKSMFRTKRNADLSMFREKTNDAARCKTRLCSERHRGFYLHIKAYEKIPCKQHKYAVCRRFLTWLG